MILAIAALALSGALHAAPVQTVQAPPRAGRERIGIGRSVRGRRLSVVRLGPRDARRRVLVVGCIHGDEDAGRAVARRLETGPLPRDTELWVLRDMNPDGHAAGTRQNAHGVDLNRNFGRGWRRLPRGRHWAGPRPLSEPESRAVRRLILRVRPNLTLWFHQPFGLVARSGADLRTERRVARALGLPLRPLPRPPGSASTWQNRALPGSASVVVELGPGVLTRAGAERLARGVRLLSP